MRITIWFNAIVLRRPSYFACTTPLSGMEGPAPDEACCKAAEIVRSDCALTLLTLPVHVAWVVPSMVPVRGNCLRDATFSVALATSIEMPRRVARTFDAGVESRFRMSNSAASWPPNRFTATSRAFRSPFLSWYFPLSARRSIRPLVEARMSALLLRLPSTETLFRNG